MENKSQFIVVDSEVLPEVISKVLEVKKLLANKEEKAQLPPASVWVFRGVHITNTATAYILMRKSLCRR